VKTLGAVVAVAAALGGVAGSAGDSGGGTTVVPRVIRHEGLNRSFLVYIPRTLSAPTTVVLGLHGNRGEGLRFREWTGRALEPLADRHGFLVVYPDAYAGRWNDCRRTGKPSLAAQRVDDVGFMVALLDRLSQDLGRRITRVFALGFSNGGHMCFRLALESPQLVTAIAAFGAHAPAPSENVCRASGRPVPVLIVSGTEDPINPFGGGRVSLQGEDLGSVLSAEQTAAYFADLSALRRVPRVDVLPERDGDPATRVLSRTWVREDGGAQVRLFVVRGGGHTIPGSRAALPAVLGRVSAEFDAIEEAWRFFASQPWKARDVRHLASARTGSGVEPGSR
jgi:polyhydroxybutyrate depolymerase